MLNKRKPRTRPFSFAMLQKRLATNVVELDCKKDPEEMLRIYQEELRQQHEALCVAQMELEASRDRYAELFEYAPVGYAVLSSSGAVEEINFTGAAMFGYSRAWIVKSPFQLYVAKTDIPRFLEHLTRCKSEDGPIITELEIKRKDGTTFNAELVTAPEREPSGTPHALRTTITDMTIHKCTEGSLRCAYDELEARVRERTLELSSALKKLSMQTAERQNLERELSEISERERRRFGQDLHDDVCQQLAGIALSASALSKNLAQNGIKESYELLQIAETINDTIGQAKDIARGLHPVELIKGGLIAALKDLSARTNSGQCCRFEKIGQLPEISEESALALFRIAQEAIHNAVKHAEAAKIVVRLKTSGNLVTLTVCDDGKGLPAKTFKCKGMGLNIMRYRANTIGAEISFGPGKNSLGTLVQCTLCVEPETSVSA